MVYLRVGWSGPERESRKIVTQAMDQLKDLDLQLFVLQEDTPENLTWLKKLGLGEHPRGAGTIIWLEHGSLIHSIIWPVEIGAKKIEEITRSLWSGK